MSGDRYDGVARSVRDVQRANGGMQRQLDRQLAEDVVIDADRRLLLRSPSGTYWAITVNDAGGLSTTNVGVNPL